MNTFTRITSFAGKFSTRMTRLCVAPCGTHLPEEMRFGLPIRVRLTSGLYIGEARSTLAAK